MSNLLNENILQLASSNPAMLNLFEKNVFHQKFKKDRENSNNDDFSDDLMRWAIAN